MRDLATLSESDLLWDPDIIQNLSNETLVKKMGQTYLSRISYYRRKAGLVSEKLGLGQQIGILLWMNRVDLLSTKGEERLLFLQSKAPWGALDAGMRFARRLEESNKLQLDFYPYMVVLNCHPSTKRLRAFRQTSRIGVGYRDKGTLPSLSTGPRTRATEDAWVLLEDVPEKMRSLLESMPELIEGEWVDLSALAELLQSGSVSEGFHSLLNP
jgi:hypothetical protein